jgi:flagellin
LNNSVARLSSGSRILNPADDAAGLAVATKFTSQIHRLDAARNSLANTLSYVQTADGYMQKIDKVLSRMGELATLAMDETKSSTDRENYNLEFQDLKTFVRDVQGKKMNGLNLFQGETVAVTNGAFGQTYSFDTTDLTVDAYAKAVDEEVFSPPPFTWEVTKDVWTTSKAGYMLREDAYKITQTYYTVTSSGNDISQLTSNAWYKAATGWSATDNGGTKYNSGALVKLGNGIDHEISAQLGSGAVNYINASSFIAKTNPATANNTPPNGNIEASDIQTNAANTFTTIDPLGMPSTLTPTFTAYQKGSFTTINPSPVYSTNISIGDVVAVNPITSGEDASATLYTAGSDITTDPTDYDVDPDAEEVSPSHVLTSSGGKWAIRKVKTALEQLSTDRASSGSVMGRLHRINDQLGLLRENLDQSVSRIRDTNVAAESTRFARHQILMNSSTEMLKQANIVPQHALRLILGL